MKTIKIAIVCLLSAVAMQAQDNARFLKAMTANLAEWKNVKTPDDAVKITNTFERIANAEPKEWLPLYYCALNTVTGAFQTRDAKAIDAIVDKAEEYINKADAISPNNSEILTVKAMCMGARIMVDPMTRGQKYGMQSGMLLETAKKLDPTNPRPYLYEAQSKYYTPEAFGGGKKVALPLLEKAEELFKNFKPQSELSPNWGMDQVIDLIKQCKS